MLYRIALPIALALIGSAGAPARADTVRIATGELPPYATQSRPDQGMALAIVRRAFELSGHQVEFHFLPWTRAQQETRGGLWDASAHWGASEERRRDFLLSDNIVTEQWLLVHRRAIKLDWTQLDDLKPYTIGVVRDYTYTPEFWSKVQKGELHGDNTSDDLVGLKKLALGRIDVMPMERNVACDLIKRNLGEPDASRLAAHPRLLTDTFTTHLILPPHVAKSAQLLADFNRGLKKVYDSGEHARLLKTVQCPSGWPEPTPGRR